MKRNIPIKEKIIINSTMGRHQAYCTHPERNFTAVRTTRAYKSKKIDRWEHKKQCSRRENRGLREKKIPRENFII